MSAGFAHSRKLSIARASAVAVALGVHGAVFLMLGMSHRAPVPRTEPPALSIIMLERFAATLTPAAGPTSPAQPPRLFTPAVDLNTAITLPDVALHPRPADSGLDALGAYMRCTMPEERDKKECERLRAEVRGKLAPQPQSESERIMMARIDREMEQRNAPTGLPCIGSSRSGMSCTAAPQWNDQHFKWK